MLVVGLAGLALETFRYRDLNDLTAIVFAFGAALLVLGVIGVIAVPLLQFSAQTNRRLVQGLGWIPGSGLVLTGVTHFTDWKFFRDNAHWLALHRKPTMNGIYAEGVVLTLLGLLLVAASFLVAYTLPRPEDAEPQA